MNYEAVADRIVVSYQLRAGMSPTEILVRHYDQMARSVVASDAVMAAEYREVRDIVAGIKPQFLIDAAKAIGSSLSDIVRLFKNHNVVRFFDKAGWSFKGVWAALKGGYKVYRTVHQVIGEYLSETKVGRWTREELVKLDQYLRENPRTKRLAGVAVGLLLFYLWTKMADTGDPEFDFDISDIVKGFGGSYSLSDIFSGPDGMRLLASVAAGVVGLSFPWPSASSVTFIGGMMRMLARKVGQKLRPSRETEEDYRQEALELGLET